MTASYTGSSLEVTFPSNFTSAHPAFPGYASFGYAIPDPLTPIQLLQRFVALVGLVGNVIAVLVVVKGRSIRSHASYVLLCNQGIADGLCCCYALLLPLVDWAKKPYTSGSGLSYRAHYFFCLLVHSSSFLIVVNFVSTVNLTCMAVERMLAVVFPLVHRQRADDRHQRLVAYAMWPFSLVFVMPFLALNNGVNPVSGVCYYNDRMRAHPWFLVTFETCGYYIPLAVMTSCYAAVVRSLTSGGAAVKKRLMNVLKTLITVVAVYVCCSVLRNALTVMAAFRVSLGPHRATLMTTGYTLKIASFCMNPLIYTLHYSDYKKELKKLMGIKNNRVTSQCNIQSTKSDSKVITSCHRMTPS